MIEEIRTGLKRWTGPHPEFDPVEGDLDESYDEVASVLFHGPDALVFIDPLMPAMGPNVAGVIGSAAAAGVFLTLLG